jgi:Flp pilus assembly protein TadG
VRHRLAGRAADEDGAVLVLVALLMVVLLGFAALAVDVSALHAERRELQNGADAAALAIAQDCAGTAGCDPSVAARYADANTGDGAAAVEDVCGAGPGLVACATPPTAGAAAGAAGWVSVGTRTRTAATGGATDQVPFRLAPALRLVSAGDFDGRTVRAGAVAAWGSPAAAPTVPLAISRCELETYRATRGGLPEGPPPFAQLPMGVAERGTFLGFPVPTTCPTGPWADSLGGFVWLTPAGGSCQVRLRVGDSVPARSDRPGCLSLDGLLGTTVLVPVFGSTSGTFLNRRYDIEGFAALHVTGYRTGFASRGTPCLLTTGSFQCLSGHFTTHVTSGTAFGGPDLGASIVTLIG